MMCTSTTQSGSLGKQNQDVCVCVYQEVYFKELTDVTLALVNLKST